MTADGTPSTSCTRDELEQRVKELEQLIKELEQWIKEMEG